MSCSLNKQIQFFEFVPLPIVRQILHFLGDCAFELTKVMRVCKQWKEIICSSQSFQKTIRLEFYRFAELDTSFFPNFFELEKVDKSDFEQGHLRGSILKKLVYSQEIEKELEFLNVSEVSKIQFLANTINELIKLGNIAIAQKVAQSIDKNCITYIDVCEKIFQCLLELGDFSEALTFMQSFDELSRKKGLKALIIRQILLQKFELVDDSLRLLKKGHPKSGTNCEKMLHLAQEMACKWPENFTQNSFERYEAQKLLLSVVDKVKYEGLKQSKVEEITHAICLKKFVRYSILKKTAKEIVEIAKGFNSSLLGAILSEVGEFYVQEKSFHEVKVILKELSALNCFTLRSQLQIKLANSFYCGIKRGAGGIDSTPAC